MDCVCFSKCWSSDPDSGRAGNGARKGTGLGLGGVIPVSVSVGAQSERGAP